MRSNSNFGQRTELSKAVASAINVSPSTRSTIIGLAMGATMLAPTATLAQNTSVGGVDTALEEVVVTGIRSSLKRVSDMKRAAVGVVDGISAQDIGSFPDTNLAESLQRITGVSIDRNRGEGSKVTVRGFGPGFNLVTLNGRQMPTANGDDRSFDFADLASEGISGVQIYKTGNADVPTGGIGGTINIQTTKPLDSPGLKSVVSAKAVHDTSTEKGDDITPEVSGIYSNTFANDTFGISVSGSYQKRDNGANTGTTGDYNGFQGTHNGWGSIPNNAAQVNRPGDSDIFVVPQSVGYELAEFSRERINGQLTLQWAPSENVEATIDYTFSEVEAERTFNNYSAWFNYGDLSTQFSDGPIASPVIFSEGGSANDFAMAAGRDGIKTENDSIGINLEWRVNDRLALEFDAHSSSAESGPIGGNGTASQLAIASFTRARTTATFNGDLPILSLDLSRPLNANDMIVTGSVFDTKKTQMDIDQAAVSGTYELNDNSAIDFGVQLTNVDNRSQFSNVQRNTWGGTTQPGDIADLLTPASASNAFDQVSNGNDSTRQADFFTFDLDALARRTEQLGATQSTGGDCGTGLCASSDFTTDRITEEESQAVYLQVRTDTELAGIPVNIKFGLRYEETDIDSQALVPEYGQIVQTGGNEFDAIPTGNQAFTRLTGDYDFVLPNLDVKFDLSDDMVFRASYSETVARPDYTDIQGGLTISTLLRQNGGNGQSGNPGLLPFESENIDFSFEYYFAEGDYASIGYFNKDVSNFIGTSILQDQVLFPSLINPATGQAATFDVTTPVNQETASIDGWEAALQYSFGETGFGFIVNATFVDGDIAYDSASLDTQFVLPGLSDSANLIGFYENERFQTRIAYNWRDDFFNGIAGAAAGTPGPVFVDSYGQWDVSASYDISDNLTVFIEGINITDETTGAYGRDQRQRVNAAQTGARFNLGARYSF